MVLCEMGIISFPSLSGALEWLRFLIHSVHTYEEHAYMAFAKPNLRNIIGST